LTVDELGALLAKAREWPEWRARRERAEPFTLVFSPDEVFDITRAEEREQMAALFRRYAALGTDVLSLRFRSSSCAHLDEQLEILEKRIAPEFA